VRAALDRARDEGRSGEVAEPAAVEAAPVEQVDEAEEAAVSTRRFS
jgi:hypothetical protein